MKKQLIAASILTFGLTTFAQPSFAMKHNRQANAADPFDLVILSIVSAMKRFLPHQHDGVRDELSRPLLTTITFVSQTGTPFYFLPYELATLMQLSPTIAGLLSDLEGADVSMIPLDHVNDDALYLLTRMATRMNHNRLLGYIRGLSARQIENLINDAEFLDSQALKGLISRALFNPFTTLPDELLPVILASVGPLGRTHSRRADQRFRRSVDISRMPIAQGGFGCTDTLPVVATIPVGKGAEQAVVHGHMLHVANSLEGIVNIIDPHTNKVVATMEASENPSLGDKQTFVVNGQKLYTVSDAYDGEYDDDAGMLSVIDINMNKVIAMIQVGCAPHKPALHGQMLYVANHGDGTISVIDTHTNEVLATIQVGIGPLTPVVHGQMLYVVNWSSGTVSVIDIGGYLPGQQ